MAAASAVGLVGLCAWPYTVDDAFIIARYASRIASGLGYTFNSGPATDGVTGPAWLLPGIIASWLRLDPVFTAKAVGLVCSILSVCFVASGVLRRAGGSAVAAVALLLMVCQPGLGGSGSSGLETGAATLLVCLAAHAALAHRVRQPRLLGASIGLLAWLRPELAFAGAVLLLAARSRTAWMLAFAGAGAVCLFRWALMGHALPLALSAKAGTLGDGLNYAGRALLVLSGGFGLALAAAGVRWGQRRDRWLGAVLLAQLFAVMLAGGDWMPGFRLFVPVLPAYAVLAGVGFVRAWQRGGAWARTAACLAGLVACALPVLDLALRVPDWRAAGASRDTIGREIARELRAETRRVALVDIGFLGWASGREVVDLAGITDHEVAAFAGGHLNKHIDPAWLERRAPDALLLHSASPPTAADDGSLVSLRGYPVEQRVARFAWVRREFRVAAVYAYAPHYYYALLLRRAPEARSGRGLGDRARRD